MASIASSRRQWLRQTQTGDNVVDEEKKSVRLDKWLWAARCFKTRSQATQSCSAGRWKVNDKRSKAGQAVRVGDLVDGEAPGGRRVLEVVGLADRRGSASLAATLFRDLTPEQPGRAWHERKGPRPTKRDRRILDQLRDFDSDD